MTHSLGCDYITETSRKYDYYNWPATSSLLTFEAQGGDDVHVLISFCNGCDGFEIVIGGWSNTYSVIREYKLENADSIRTEVLTYNLKYFYCNMHV